MESLLGVDFAGKLQSDGYSAYPVVVSSLENSSVTDSAMGEVRCGVWLGVTEEFIVEMQWTVGPGVDCFLEYRDGVTLGRAERQPEGPTAANPTAHFD